MSLFQKDSSQLKKTIQFFNSLQSQQKALIVSELTHVRTNPELLNQLSPLLEAIQNDISKYDETTMAQKLFDLGMEETYAKLLVNSMIKQAPTIEYDISVLAKLSDDVFKEKAPLIMNDIWVKKLPIDALI